MPLQTGTLRARKRSRRPLARGAIREDIADAIKHGFLLLGRAGALQTFVGQQLVKQRKEQLAITLVGEEQRQRCESLFRFITGNDFLFATDSPPLIGRQIRKIVGVCLC